MMDLRLQKGKNKNDLSYDEWDFALWGKSMDERGRIAQSFLNSRVDINYTLVYDSDNFEINIEGNRYQLDDIDSFFEQFEGAQVILECTTLGFTEILVSLKYLNKLNAEIYLLYLEPNEYKKTLRPGVLHKREFELSDEIPGFKAIPGFAIRLTDKEPQKGVFFLGFEASRLNRAFEEFQMLRSNKCSVIFGVPAFKPGWEMNSFANNIRVVKEKNIGGGIYFSAADNPKSAMKKLEAVHKGLHQNEKLFIAPLGPKPSSIGTAIFLNQHPDVGVIYDHPFELEDRSNEVLNWNLYEIVQ